MNRGAALGALAVMVVGTIAALVAPWPALVAIVVAGTAIMRGRRAFAAFVAVSLPINVAILWLIAGDPMAGAVGGLRLAAALAANLAILTRVGAPRILDGLRLPPRPTALLAAVTLAAHDIGRDFARLRDARRLEGSWPRGRFARARECARLVPALVLSSHRRAMTRRDALQLAGVGFPGWFVPLVAVAALAAAGRMAFLALPNVALTYLVAFLGGLLYGPWIGAAGAALGMGLTDLMLTGLYPAAFVNAPAMALLGLLGGSLRRVQLSSAASAAIGIVSTFLFSVAADVGTWVVIYPGQRNVLAPLILAGLVFNVIPALVNGALFGAAVSPTVRAFRAWQGARPGSTARPASGAELPPAGL